MALGLHGEQIYVQGVIVGNYVISAMGDRESIVVFIQFNGMSTSCCILQDVENFIVQYFKFR